MLDVLVNEFKDFMPFENNQTMIDLFAESDLFKFKDNQFVEIPNFGDAVSHKEWRMTFTAKGVKKAKVLCKNVGVVVNLEMDLEDPSINKITISMYDKSVMPVVEDLYYQDGTSLKEIKQEEECIKNDIFDPFILQIEADIDGMLQEDGCAGNGAMKNEEMLLPELFSKENEDIIQDQEDDDDVVMEGTRPTKD